jgi:hypothetical protein
MANYGPRAHAKVALTMDQFETGKLTSGTSDKKIRVTSKQWLLV